MNKYLIAAFIGVASGVVATTQLPLPLVAQEANKVENEDDVYQKLSLFGDIFDQVRESYVEEVDDKELIEAAINGMLTSLDPHSSYMTANDFEDMQVQTKGEFGGLGIEVTQEGGVVKVIAPMDDTPAYKAGIEAGDLITHVDGHSLIGLTLNEAVDKMRGPVGAAIIVTVIREGEPDPFDVKIVRDTIKVTPVRSRTVNNIIILRITTFNEKTYSSLEEKLKAEVEALGGIDNVGGFVIDLRNNPGGLLTQAIQVSDAFLDRGEIVSTRSRGLGSAQKANARAGDLTQGKPIVVLVNGGSASASEIVAGALKDHHRAVIVGTKTFGKGSVQTIVPLENKGAMRLTTARYYTPSGRSIQALGVMPDIVVEQPPRPKADAASAENNEEKSLAFTPVSEADLRGTLTNDSISDEERALLEEELSKANETAELRAEDYQLAYAIDILRGLFVTHNNKTP